jgi:hypothetical protein
MIWMLFAYMSFYHSCKRNLMYTLMSEYHICQEINLKKRYLGFITWS